MTKVRLYQSVVRDIRERIASGEFPPGTRLPGERELAERFAVSRVTIREAEIALEALGLITIKTGSGVFVRDHVAADPGELPDVSAFELTAARTVVEAEAAALAAVNITDAGIGELDRIVAAMAKVPPDDFSRAEDIDREFHLAIGRMSGNPVIEHFVGSLWRMRTELPRVRAIYVKVCSDDAGARTSEHASVLDALKVRDPIAARRAMRDHFERLFEALLQASEAEALVEIRRKVDENRERFLVTTRASK